MRFCTFRGADRILSVMPATVPAASSGAFAPARFAEYFRELAEIVQRTGAAPDRDAWTDLYGRYDTTFLDAG